LQQILWIINEKYQLWHRNEAKRLLPPIALKCFAVTRQSSQSIIQITFLKKQIPQSEIDFLDPRVNFDSILNI